MDEATGAAERDVLIPTERGLYCPAGDFYVDPVRAVPRAVITHGHSDHARRGCGAYLCAAPCVGILRRRLGGRIRTQGVPWGETVVLGDANVSFHPAGHILGSAQVRVERGGAVWVVSGDYATVSDPTCHPFEPVRCHTFVTESTFALPVYRWAPAAETFGEMESWRARNARDGLATLFCGYSLGKAQRILGGLSRGDGPIYVDDAVGGIVDDYRAEGIDLPPTKLLSETPAGASFVGATIVAPPQLLASEWLGRIGPCKVGYASGWMMFANQRRARRVDRGFPLSDHADWPGLLGAIEATGASRVFVMHGFVEPLVRYLRERGVDAAPLGGAR
jgi:putative mRNA 3-end processing factor